VIICRCTWTLTTYVHTLQPAASIIRALPFPICIRAVAAARTRMGVDRMHAWIGRGAGCRNRAPVSGSRDAHRRAGHCHDRAPGPNLISCRTVSAFSLFISFLFLFRPLRRSSSFICPTIRVLPASPRRSFRLGWWLAYDDTKSQTRPRTATSSIGSIGEERVWSESHHISVPSGMEVGCMELLQLDATTQ